MPFSWVTLSLISLKCPWKQYRQPENGRKIHDSSALFLSAREFGEEGIIKFLQFLTCKSVEKAQQEKNPSTLK